MAIFLTFCRESYFTVLVFRSTLTYWPFSDYLSSFFIPVFCSFITIFWTWLDSLCFPQGQSLSSLCLSFPLIVIFWAEIQNNSVLKSQNQQIHSHCFEVHAFCFCFGISLCFRHPTASRVDKLGYGTCNLNFCFESSLTLRIILSNFHFHLRCCFHYDSQHLKNCDLGNCFWFRSLNGSTWLKDCRLHWPNSRKPISALL